MQSLISAIRHALRHIQPERAQRSRRPHQTTSRVAVVEILESRVLLSASVAAKSNAKASAPQAAASDPTIFVALFSGAGTSSGEVTGMSELADYLEANVPNSVAVAFAPGPNGYKGSVVSSQVNNQLLIPYHFDAGVDTIVLIGHSYGGDLIRTITQSRTQRGQFLPDGLVFYDPIDPVLVNRRLDLDQSNNPHPLPAGYPTSNVINYVQRTDLVLRGYDLTGLQSTVITGLGTSAHTAIDQESAGTYDDVALFIQTIATANASRSSASATPGFGVTRMEFAVDVTANDFVASQFSTTETSVPALMTGSARDAGVNRSSTQSAAATQTAKAQSHNSSKTDTAREATIKTLRSADVFWTSVADTLALAKRA